MTPEDLRASIPALDDAVYLNTGASGPSPRRVVDAAERALERQRYDAHATGDPYESALEEFERTRVAIAEHVGAGSSEIALTSSTTDAINVVAGAIDWAPGDVVVRTDVEHAAGILPWERLERVRDVEVRVVETEGGRIPVDAFAEAVEGARLAVFSAITWTHGTRLPVTELVEIAHDAGARVLVDAVQAPGQTALDVREWGTDFAAAAGHKWLLGPWGAGFLYAREDVAESLEPPAVGYRSVEERDSGVQYKQGAGRFEVGTASPAPYAGLREAIDVVEEVGLGAIEARIADLTRYLADELSDERLLSPHDAESGLVSFRVDEPEATVERLAEEGVVIRSIPLSGAVRASVHAINTRADVDRLVAALEGEC